MEQPCSDGCRMRVREEESDGDTGRETKTDAERKHEEGFQEATAASLCCPSSAQSELCRIARKQPFSLFFY